MTVPSELYERVALLEAQVRYLSERTQIPLPDFRAVAQSQLTPQIQQLIANGDKIAAIKAYREATGCDLATAKKVIESY
jgi:ribosomal protein L7/L12